MSRAVDHYHRCYVSISDEESRRRSIYSTNHHLRIRKLAHRFQRYACSDEIPKLSHSIIVEGEQLGVVDTAGHGLRHLIGIEVPGAPRWAGLAQVIHLVRRWYYLISEQEGDARRCHDGGGGWLYRAFQR